MAFTSFECAVTRKISHQDFTVCFVLIPDEAEAKKETTESVAFVVCWLFCGADSFLILAHFAKGSNQCAVGVDFIRCRKF